MSPKLQHVETTTSTSSAQTPASAAANAISYPEETIDEIPVDVDEDVEEPPLLLSMISIC
jgi:hypothetical protein